jgi:Flp pilus assembly protein TadB
MAQTKKKRRTKHRGNAAGTIETRGRTGRPPSAADRKKQSRNTARVDRLSKEPTWRSSLTKASFAAVIMFVFLLLTTKGSNRIGTALVFAVFALVIYVPAGYYMDRWLWRRRQRRMAMRK